MELKQLKYFLKLYELGSFVKAAQELYITQQGLSMSITRLEDELGTRLFQRTNKGLLLTPAGELLNDYAARITSLGEECLTRFQEEYGGNQVVSISLNEEYIPFLPASVIQLLENQTPGYPVQMKIGTGVDHESRVSSGACTLAFICGPVDKSKYDSRLLLQQQYYYVVNAKHPLAEKEYLEVNDLKGLSLVFPAKRGRLYQKLKEICQREAFEPNVVLEIRRQNVICDIVRKDETLVGQIMGHYARSLSTDELRILPFHSSDNKPDTLDFYLIWSRTISLSEQEKKVRSFILKAFRQT